MESKITKLIESTVNDLGFELVKVTIHGTAHTTLEVLIERKDEEKLQVGDCQLVSRNISAVLDVEDVLAGKYFLEVSSTGLERPLVKLQDFERFVDRDIKIRLKTAWNGNLTYTGKLLGLDGDKVKLKSKNVELSFDYDSIKRANLVFTEEMFRALLKKKK
ncbi:MAG: ribosome maturation factor RimP [Rickettsiaceae bacterium]|nr:ribosome maturation factor RimP [Rickettsiaceae bacterium]MDP4832167.1 ribosome maturation factor RimP [Rickettsiaceae bacterium]MDP5020363.1 ribosome maturation factor RimP [Rickettsiaceae bacterium]MDP5082855.1 ribosome maturation factor RimP [Rickettsiaceae bacterium]